jgi:hypothetical protein
MINDYVKIEVLLVRIRFGIKPGLFTNLSF